MSSSQKDHDKFAVLRIIVTYAFFGGIWIYFSDTVVGWIVHDPVLLTYVAISKGMLFIAITASLLYFLIARYAKRLLKINSMLREREDLLHSVASNTPGVIYRFYSTDAGDFGVNYVSDRAPQIFGLSTDAEQFFPAFTARVVPEDRSRFLESIREAVAAGAPWTFEGRFVKSDGEMLWFHGRSTPHRDKDCLLYNGVLLDITDRKRMEEALVKSEERFKSIVSTSQEWIWSIDADGCHTFSNAAVQNILGYHPDTIVGPVFSKLLYEKDIPRATEVLLRCSEEKTGWTNLVLRWKHRDGTIRYLESNSVPVTDNNGVLKGFHGADRDITYRKRMEEDLRESEEKFSRIFRMSPDTMTISRISDGVYLDVNDEFSRQMGHAREDAIGRSAVDLEIWVDLSERDRMAELLRTNGEIQGQEYRFRCRDGIIITGEMSARIVTIGGEPCLLSMVRDISERIEARRALGESEEKFRSVVERSLVGIAIIDDTLRYTYVNEEFCRIAGYSRQEMEGRDFTFPLTEESSVLVTERFKRRQAGEDVPSHYEFSFVRKSGSIRIGEIRSSVYLDSSGRAKTIIQVTDITDRKLADETLKKSEALYRLLAENVSDIIFTMDSSLRFTYISPSVERIRGYTVEEAMAQTPEEALTPASLKVVERAFEEEIEIESSRSRKLWRTRTEELEEYCKDGSTIWTESTFSPLRDGDNNLVGFLGITRDITERKKVQEEKKRLEDQLVRTQKIEAIGTLAGGIAHDFNNLLTGILGNVSLVLMKMEEGDPLRERLKNIEEYVQRGSDLTKQLLGFARGGKYEVMPTDLGAFMKKSSGMFGRTKKEIKIHHRVQDGLWTVDVDRGQMEQVFLNLFINAWQSMPGGGSLYLSVDNVELGEIDVSPYNLRPGKYVRVTVADTGVGMSEAVKARIFEPFFTTKERERGTGLGLASVYGIIKNHGGFINVESREGQGSSFTFYLPASDKVPVKEGDSAKDDVLTGSETILIIDDESMILDIGTRMLESLNYTVMTARGGEQGIQIFEKDHDRIDLVILDMIMPDLSGKETFDALLSISPSVRVLLSSGYSLDDQAREIMSRGCKGFIQKPFTMAELSKKIRNSLDV